jgi:hypothetical protein
LIAKLPLAERVTTSTGYALRFTVPSSVAEGEYQLWLHNGRGGKAGWVRFSTFIEAPLDTVFVKKAKVWPTTVFNITSYSGTDDDKFAAAIAAASANGGGKIYGACRHLHAHQATRAAPLHRARRGRAGR